MALWTDHVTALFNYSRGLATDDTAVRDDAQAQLVAFENGLADFFSSASQGRLPRDAARAAVQTHVEHLTEQADAYAANDYARADALYRETYAHTFDLGHTLATTLLPPDQAAAPGPAVVAAAVGAGPAARRARRAGRRRAARRRDEQPRLPRGGGCPQRQHQRPHRRGGHPVRRAGRAAVHVAVGRPRRRARGVHGRGRGQRRGRRDAARRSLRDFEGQLAAFLDSATGSKVPAPDLAKAFLAHDDMLTQQVDAFAGRDYPRAHDLAYHTYQDMFGLSRRLADAFGETVAARLPQGGAQTGRGHGGVAGTAMRGAVAARVAGRGRARGGVGARGSRRRPTRRGRRRPRRRQGRWTGAAG